MSSTPLDAVIVGAGHRAMTYASYAKHHPEQLRIVGVADLLQDRRRMVQKDYDVPDDRLFATAEDLAAAGKIGDIVINGTMDHQHVPTALPLLEAGYHMLLEKPFATSEQQMWQLVDAAAQHKRHVSICHVLRYAPFYAAIRQKIEDGILGDLINIQAVEHVSYHHMGVGFVRGKWSQEAFCESTMLMAKSCHDLDLIAWMHSGVPVSRVSSFGSNFQFRQIGRAHV